MKIFGSLKKVFSVVFSQNTFDITFQPDTSTTYTAARTIKLPPGDASSQMVGDTSTQSLTNKTLDSTSTISGVTMATLTPDGTHTLTMPTATDTLVGKATTDTLTNKTMSGSSNTFSNISLTASVTGTLPIGNGGTNATTANAALNNLLPSQASNAGKVLTTDGTNASWVSDTDSSVVSSNTTWSQVSATVTISNASPGVVTYTAHGLVTGQAVYLTTTGALPTGLSANTIYYVHTVQNANQFTLAATYGGSDINTTSAGSGTHTINVTSVNVVHNFGTKDVMIQLYDLADGAQIGVDEMFRTDTNNVLLNASQIPSSSGWRVMILRNS